MQKRCTILLLFYIYVLLRKLLTAAVQEEVKFDLVIHTTTDDPTLGEAVRGSKENELKPRSK